MTMLAIVLTILHSIAFANGGVLTQANVVPKGPFPGFIEISSGVDTPIVGITIDAPAEGNRDGFIDILLLAELRPGVAKPPSIRALGEISWLQDFRSLRVVADGKTLVFLVGQTKLQPGERPDYVGSAVDVIISTRRADGVAPKKHDDAVAMFLKMPELPFKRK
jgi:hypothetical protein